MKAICFIYFLLLSLPDKLEPAGLSPENLLFAGQKSKDKKIEPEVEPPIYKKTNFTYLISGGKRMDKMLAYVKHMVSIRSRRPQKYFGDNHFCAGTIIGARKILTAAHCVMDKRKVVTRPRRLLVVAGSPNRLRIDNTTRQLSVEEVIPHQNYAKFNTDDIAIIILVSALPIYSPGVAIMPLPRTGPDYGSNCTAIGWGRMYYNGPLAAMAAHVEVFLFQPHECHKFLPDYDIRGVLCAGDKVLYNEDPCRGDSGGPLICNGELTGVISWTIGCGHKYLPSLYTEVWYHLDWIVANEARRLPSVAYLIVAVILLNFINIFMRLMNRI